MTIQVIKGGMKIPAYRRLDTSPAIGGTTGTLLDATGEKCAIIIRVPKDGTLHKVGFRTGTVTTGDDLKVSFQDVAATGFPDETADQYRVVTIADANDDAWFTTGILSSDGTDTGTKRSVTKDQEIAIVFEFNSYVAGNLYIAHLESLGSSGLELYPYIATKLGAGPTWAKVNSGSSIPAIALEYSDGSYEPIGTFPIVSVTTQSFKSDTAGADEYAMPFSALFPCRIAGMGCLIDLDGNADLILYEGTTVRASVSADSDMRASTSTAVLEMRFTTPYSIAANTTYYASVKPTTTTAVVITYFTVDSAAVMDSFDGGQSLCMRTRLDAGAWSTDAADLTKRPFFWLIIDGFDDATGAGGLAANPLRGFIG